ncbi:HNH endonuclease [Pseudomonas viridiflava]
MDGYTWHHHQDSGRVPELIHKKT